jgi:serine/threonine protein kinase
VDVWALGVLYYRMLEGKYPFRMIKNERQKWQYLKMKIHYTEKVSKINKIIINSMLNKSFKERASLPKVIEFWNKYIK